MTDGARGDNEPDDRDPQVFAVEPAEYGDAPARAGEVAVDAADGERPAGAAAWLSHELRDGRVAPAFAAAVIAWAMTVAPVGFARGATATVASLAMAALLAGATGPLLLRRRPRLARHVGISLFLACTTATWLVTSAALHPARVDPTRGALGAVAWGVFALSWSDRWGKRPPPVPRDPEAPLLLARGMLPRFASPIVALGIGVGVAYLVFAFSVRDPHRALVAQVVALACAVAVVSASAAIAISRGKHRTVGARRLTPPIVRWLLFLAAFSVAGAVLRALR